MKGCLTVSESQVFKQRLDTWPNNRSENQWLHVLWSDEPKMLISGSNVWRRSGDGYNSECL